jgi:mRNA interferase ChpB
LSKLTYHPGRGDVIHMNFSPSSGREMAGPHYALVLSSAAFSRKTGLCVVLPATTKYHADQRLHDTHLMVEMPPLKHLPQRGWVYVHQIKTIDYRERGTEFVEKVPEDFLLDVLDRTLAIIDPPA